MKKLLLMVAVAGCLLYGSPAVAGPIGTPTVGPGDSWVVSWLDTTSGLPYDKTEFFVTAGGYEFDAAAATSEPGWNGYLVNPTYSYIAGPVAHLDKTLTLFFNGSAPSGGVKVDLLVWYQGSLVPGQSWRWTNLPQGQWEVITPDPYDPIYNRVPDGGVTLSLLGFALVGLGAVRRRCRG